MLEGMVFPLHLIKCQINLEQRRQCVPIILLQSYWLSDVYYELYWTWYSICNKQIYKDITNHSSEHWMFVIWLFKYLMKTIDYGLNYERYPVVLEGYYDTNWISDFEEFKSTSGYVFTLGNVAVSWKSKKQSCISWS